MGLFYLSQLVAIAAVAKSFGAYAVTLTPMDAIWKDIFAVGIVLTFIMINLVGAALVARFENIIVIIKLSILIFFSVVALFYIDPTLLSVADMPPLNNMLFAIGLVGLLYIMTSVAVLGNMPLDKVIEAKDYALAEAAKPIFGTWGFKIMALTALLATASAINATLYATTEIGYTLAKEGNLPPVYTYNLHRSYQGLLVSGVLILPMILFFDLSQITTIAALVVLIIQGLTHVGHLFRIQETGANKFLIIGAIISMFGIAVLTLYYTSTHKMPMIAMYILGSFVLAFMIEIGLRLSTKRVIEKQIKADLVKKIEKKIKNLRDRI